MAIEDPTVVCEYKSNRHPYVSTAIRFTERNIYRIMQFIGGEPYKIYPNYSDVIFETHYAIYYRDHSWGWGSKERIELKDGNKRIPVNHGDWVVRTYPYGLCKYTHEEFKNEFEWVDEDEAWEIGCEAFRKAGTRPRMPF